MNAIRWPSGDQPANWVRAHDPVRRGERVKGQPGRLYRIRLQPANPNYPPQFYDDVRIQGKLIGVIRRLD